MMHGRPGPYVRVHSPQTWRPAWRMVGRDLIRAPENKAGSVSLCLRSILQLKHQTLQSLCPFCHKVNPLMEQRLVCKEPKNVSSVSGISGGEDYQEGKWIVTIPVLMRHPSSHLCYLHVMLWWSRRVNKNKIWFELNSQRFPLSLNVWNRKYFVCICTVGMVTVK